ncbi:MAG: tRNA 2-thiouridine(34) synthase MnmA, partial [Alistipes sp.]|nr:tRNA 2-thiouridine(34) synthase MnmA [Candidatus Minthomonas equi]
MADFKINGIPDLSPAALGLPEDAKGKTVCVGLSGGVDSSVAALLLKEAGYNVFALFMQNWHDTEGTLHGECEWEEDKSVAEMVARKIGIPFHFIDLSDVYRQQVVDYMFEEYSRGRTPNPDVMCNSKIKFAAFLEAAQKLGADYVATGHYCRKAADEGNPSICRILAGTDPNKDQSYFLCRLTQAQLSKAIFPIGDTVKPEVRRMAHEAGLPSADKKDSQGICFVGKVDLPVFLQQKLKSRKGKVVEIFPSFYDTLEGYPGYGRHLSVSEETHRAGEDVIFHFTGGDEVSPCGCDDIPSTDGLAALSATYRYRIGDGKIIGEHIGAQYYT